MTSASISQSSNKIRSTSTLQQGQSVKHPFFGCGVIKKITGDRTVEVEFDRHGIKTLHLDYAKLELKD